MRVTLVTLTLFGLAASETLPARAVDHRILPVVGSWLRTSFGATRGPAAIFTEFVVGPLSWKLTSLLAFQTFEVTTIVARPPRPIR
jgi:hypothetical protein